MESVNITAVFDELWKNIELINEKKDSSSYFQGKDNYICLIENDSKELMDKAIAQKLIESSIDIDKGGVAIALAKMAVLSNIGCEVNISVENEIDIFNNSLGKLVVEVKPENIQSFNDIALELDINYTCIGKTGGDVLFINGLYKNMDKVKDTYLNKGILNARF